MVHRCISVMLLLATLILVSGTPAHAELLARPEGTLYERVDGTYGYIVSNQDRVGQWQVAFGSPKLWTELVAVNPQLADPDVIKPGNELNVPPSLVKLFHIIAEVDSIGGPQPAKGAGPSMSVTTQTVEVADHGFPLWAVALLAVLGTVVIGSIGYGFYRSRVAFSSPYSGPPVREGGLPTAEAAAQHFTSRYREERNAMTVGASTVLPPLVRIERIRAVDVKGLMLVRFANRTERRDLRQWTPAWEATLTRGLRMYTLTACANDVRRGGGLSALPHTQVRARQDVPEREPNVQVWPVVTETPAPEPVVTEPAVEQGAIPSFTSVKVTGPRRFVLHTSGDRETIVDLGILQGITLGIDDGDITVTFGDQRQVIGRLIEEQSSSEAPTTAPKSQDVHSE